ncbi:MAG: sensor histidine kinase [Oscillospiraceae bacterium]
MKHSRNLLRRYIACRLPLLLLFAVFSAIFAAVFFLYALEFEALLYGILLCAAVTIAAAALDFWRFCRKISLLERLQSEIVYSVENLPVSGSPVEAEYIELIRTLSAEMGRREGEFTEANNSMTDYYSMWVHQIKTPISAMKLLLEPGAGITAEQREVLRAELFKIEQYVEMVLYYVRLGSETTDYVIKQYKLNSIVKRCVRRYAQLFINKRISVELNIPDITVLTDEKWLGYAIEQILSNAVKYTKQGGKIEIFTENDALIIRDNGIGISPEELPRITEKGFTGANGRRFSESALNGGRHSTGLGLYLCGKILPKLSHTLDISSELGKGTTVRIGIAKEHIGIE